MDFVYKEFGANEFRIPIEAMLASIRKGEGNAVCFDVGQANKSARGMPWHQEPMKDATSCEKLRGAANKR